MFWSCEAKHIRNKPHSINNIFPGYVFKCSPTEFKVVFLSHVCVLRLASLSWLTEHVVWEWESGCPIDKSKPKQKCRNLAPDLVTPVWFLLDPKETFWIPKQPKTRHSITVYKSVSVVPFLYSPCQSMNADRPFQYLFERNLLEEMGGQHKHYILWMTQKSRLFGLQQKWIVTMC